MAPRMKSLGHLEDPGWLPGGPELGLKHSGGRECEWALQGFTVQGRDAGAGMSQLTLSGPRGAM